MHIARPAVILFTLICSSAQAADDWSAMLEQTAIPSVSVARIQNGEVVMTAAYGQRDAQHPATTATLYNIASLTKPITAEVILREASAGTFSLDEPVYPSWTDPDLASDRRHEQLTVRLLLSHRSGFPNWRSKSGLAFERAPGSAVGYSGEGYQYAATFAQVKSGKPFDTIAQDRLFGPAGMLHTTYTSKPWFADGIAAPHDDNGNAMAPTIAAHFNAADLVYTTAADYAAFMLDVLDDKGLSPSIAAERRRVQADNRASYCQGDKAASCPTAVGFGLGWEVLQFKNETIFMHTGKDPGLFTFAYLNKTTRDGAVILTNSDHGWKAVLPVLERFAASPAYLAFLRSQVK